MTCSLCPEPAVIYALRPKPHGYCSACARKLFTAFKKEESR